jgi:hypothetical protein
MQRRRPVLAATLATLTAAALFAVPAAAQAAPSDADLAYRWAPIHYQDTSSANSTADYLGPVDYDRDWNTRNNWENLPENSPNLVGTVYYSVVETGTHWFVVYAYFHPRDWKLLGSHENDMEGLVVAVRKDGSEYGALEAMVTIAHDNFYSYTPPGSPYTDGAENIDGTVIMQSHDGGSHPTTFQEDRGHGAYRWNGDEFPGGDGVVYFPSRDAAEVPSSGNDRSVAYRLVDTFADGNLWARRASAETFAEWGVFGGDNGRDNAARTAWAWDDHDDDVGAGLMATDPARLIFTYFGNTSEFELDYTRNRYQEEAPNRQAAPVAPLPPEQAG